MGAPRALQLDDSLVGFESATTRLPGRATFGPLERGKVLLVLLVCVTVVAVVSGATSIVRGSGFGAAC